MFQNELNIMEQSLDHQELSKPNITVLSLWKKPGALTNFDMEKGYYTMLMVYGWLCA